MNTANMAIDSMLMSTSTDCTKTFYASSVIFCGILLQSVHGSYGSLKAPPPFSQKSFLVSLYSFGLVYVSLKNIGCQRVREISKLCIASFL